MSQRLTMRQLLYNMSKTEASDLHLKVGLPPIYRIGGSLTTPPGLEALSAEDTDRLLTEIIPPSMRHRIDEEGDLDFSTFQHIDPPQEGASERDAKPERFRCNVFRSGGAMHAAIRRVKPEIPTFDSLNLPDVYRRLSDETHEGLILVIGVTGCGKSTTLACMLERINETRSENIITIEDPVEYQLHSEKSVISQREIGTDVSSYGEALRYVVRQDPDVIFIGELRDHDTVLAAIQAAETGHLVFGSLHSADTMQCFSRIVEFFPQHEHQFIRSALANSMKAICAQRLLPANKDVAGVPVVPATEVLLSNASVREKIREAEDEDLPAIINASGGEGMRSFTNSLAELVETEMVSLQHALEHATNREAPPQPAQGRRGEVLDARRQDQGLIVRSMFGIRPSGETFDPGSRYPVGLSGGRGSLAEARRIRPARSDPLPSLPEAHRMTQPTFADTRWQSASGLVGARPVEPGVEVGGLVLERTAGRHACADRWLARDLDTGAPFVAYRVDRRAGAPTATTFRLAVEMLTSLRHRHLLPVLWLDQEAPGGRWLVCPFPGASPGPAPGVLTLDEVRKRRDGGALSTHETVFVAEQTLRAAAYAHARGVAHGAIGADELLLDRRGAVRVELYGLRRRLQGKPASGADDHAEEVRSIVRVAWLLATGREAGEADADNAPRRVRGVRADLFRWLADGLTGDGYPDAVHALRALGAEAPETTPEPRVVVRRVRAADASRVGA